MIRAALPSGLAAHRQAALGHRASGQRGFGQLGSTVGVLSAFRRSADCSRSVIRVRDSGV
jgi:hypothetical protein